MLAEFLCRSGEPVGQTLYDSVKLFAGWKDSLGAGSLIAQEESHPANKGASGKRSRADSHGDEGEGGEDRV